MFPALNTDDFIYYEQIVITYQYTNSRIFNLIYLLMLL